MDKDTNMTGEEYAALRRELGMTQQDLAVVLGLAVSTIGKRESGASPIDSEAEHAIRRLAESASEPGATEPEPAA